MKFTILTFAVFFSINSQAELNKHNHIQDAIHDCVIKKDNKCDGNSTCKDMIKKIANSPHGDRLYTFTYKILDVKFKKVYEGLSQSSDNFGKKVATYKCDVKYEIDKVIPYASKTQRCEEVTEEYVICNDRQYVFKKTIFDDLRRNVKRVEDNLGSTPGSIDGGSVSK